jgi:hypothetical protein
VRQLGAHQPRRRKFEEEYMSWVLRAAVNAEGGEISYSVVESASLEWEEVS